jgi:hypothetical protein
LGLTATADAAISFDISHYYNPTVTNNPVDLYVSASSDTCDAATFTYAWDFGDGSVRSTGDNQISHTWSDPGDYTVKLTVTDNCGESQSTSYVETVKQDQPPVGAFHTDVADLTVYADPSATTDDDGFSGGGATPTAGYVWQWGDGSGQDYSYAGISGGLISHQYAAPGTYTITMTPYDANAYGAAVSHTVTVGARATVWSFHEDTSRRVHTRGSWVSYPCTRVACSPNQTERVSTHEGDSVRLRFHGTRGIVVATKNRHGGQARVFLDGQYRTTISLHRRHGIRDGVQVYETPRLPVGRHIIRVKVTDARVALDGFYSRS